MLPDHKFGLPKVKMTVLAHLPREVLRRLPSLAMLGLFRSAVLVHLKEFLYEAKLAGIVSKVEVVPTGLKLALSGFSDKLEAFAAALGARVAGFCRLPEPALGFLHAKFEILRLDEIKRIENLARKEPVAQFGRVHEFATTPGRPSLSAQIGQLKALSLEEYLAFHESLLSRVYVEALVSGNVVAAGAKKLATAFGRPFRARGLFDKLGLPEINHSPTIRLRERRVAVYEQPLVDRGEPNSLLDVQFQMPQNAAFEHVNLLLGRYLWNPFFEDLRSEQQVGYAVFAFAQFRNDTASMHFLIQSSSQALTDLSRRIREFIEKHRARVRQLSAAEFESLRSGAVAKAKQEFASIEKQHDFQFREIQLHSYRFDRKQKAVGALSRLTKQDLVDYFERLFFREQRVMELRLTSASERERQAEPGEADWKLGDSVLPVQVFRNEKELQKAHELDQDATRKVRVYVG